jgi:ABC-2 type transport system permease protein
MSRVLRGAYVIARRDFGATVLSKAFLFFLLGPLFPLLLAGLFGSIGARVSNDTAKPMVAVVASSADFAKLQGARDRLAQALDDDSVVKLVREPAEPNLAAQQHRLLASTDPPFRAVLSGSLESPHLTGPIDSDPSLAGQLRLIIANARSPEAPLPQLALTRTDASSGSLAKDRAVTAQIGQSILFFLTILLSGMLLSQVIEEKSNKIIEVIAAAVPIDSMFIGKLFAMLAASVVGLVVWITAGALLIQMISHGGVRTLPPPAVGWPAFLTLAVIYFAMNYLLLGAVFLTIGAQAATVREVQTLSMPVTFGQVLIFGFASTVIGNPNSPAALAAAVFPLSSPMAMLARAAQSPMLWPQLLAILWQALWVVVILRVGAKLFRKTVLKSGPRGKWWRRATNAELAGHIS